MSEKKRFWILLSTYLVLAATGLLVLVFADPGVSGSIAIAIGLVILTAFTSFALGNPQKRK